MDRAEIQGLYEKYGAALYRRAVSIVKNDQSALEILQDVFVAVIKSADSFRGEASPYTWLYGARRLQRLDDLSQKIFVYRYWDEMNQEEIAEILGITRKTVYLRLEKIEERLRKFLK